MAVERLGSKKGEGFQHESELRIQGRIDPCTCDWEDRIRVIFPRVSSSRHLGISAYIDLPKGFLFWEDRIIGLFPGSRNELAHVLNGHGWIGLSLPE